MPFFNSPDISRGRDLGKENSFVFKYNLFIFNELYSKISTSLLTSQSSLPNPNPHFPILTSHFPILASHFSLPNPHFPLLASHFSLLTFYSNNPVIILDTHILI
jgi:hypothetical protein